MSHGSLHEINVFSVLLTQTSSNDLIHDSQQDQKQSWQDAYHTSSVFSEIYCLHTTKDNTSSFSPGTFQRAMNYRVAEETGLLWIFRRGVLIPCIPESKILSVLQVAHDGEGHWDKRGTLAKLRNYAY